MLGCACVRRNFRICSAVMPLDTACCTLSLVRDATERLGNLEGKAESQIKLNGV